MITPMLKLKQMRAELGTKRAVAEALGVHESYIHDLLAGKRDISERMALKLGFEKIVTFEPLPAGMTVEELPGPEGADRPLLVKVTK